MQHIIIKIGNLGDPPLFPEYSDSERGEIPAIGILEGGMTSGAASVGLTITQNDGPPLFVEMSASMWHHIDSAIRGAEQRWAEKKRN